MKRILFVDDEVQILKALIRLFMDTDFEVITAEGGSEALEILKSEEVNMIVSDMRMPGMNGYELLAKVKELYPNTMRIILSGYADEKVVFRALQKNIARLYMFKPWENDYLISLVSRMFEIEEMLNDKNLLAIINNIESLPTIKENYLRIVNLINSDTDIPLISSEIEKDVSISVKLLQVANSAFYGAKTGSVKQAVSYIGLQNTKNLVLSTSIIENMSDKGLVGEVIEDIWNHSFMSNKLLAFLYEKHLKKKIPDGYSSAALLHNIGIVFFLKFFREKYVDIIRKVDASIKNIKIIEREEFKFSHCEAGAYLLKWWEFPQGIVEAALFHHHPMDEKVVNKEIVCAVHLALNYAWKLIGKDWSDGLDESVFDVLGISKIAFEESLSMFNV